MATTNAARTGIPSGGTKAKLMVTGNKFNPFMDVSSVNSGTALSANQWRAAKIFIPADHVISASVNVVVATAGALVAAGLYNADEVTGLAKYKAYDFGQFDMNVVGVTEGSPVSVAAGEYWLVWHCNAAISGSNVTVITSTNRQPIVGSNLYSNRYDNNYTYTYPLPATFDPSTQSPANLSFVCPVFLKIKS